jgi:hypothetical protein
LDRPINTSLVRQILLLGFFVEIVLSWGHIKTTL